MTDYKEYAKQMRENATKNEQGNIVCSPELWEETANIIERAILPPCKVGDSCYPLNASETELTCEEKISRITISEKNIIIGYYEHWDYYNRCRKADNWRLPLRTRILGKGVFLTKEEAEVELEKRGKENA